MKKLLLSAAVALLSIPAMSAASATFNFVDGAEKNILKVTDASLTEISFTGTTLTYDIPADGGSLYFFTGEGNEINISCTSNLAPSYDTYQIGDSDNFEGDVFRTVDLYPGADGAVFNVTVSTGTGTVVPKPTFLLPGYPGAESIYGFSIMWGYYSEIRWAGQVAQSNKGQVFVPGFDEPFSYDLRINENAPGEETGGDATAEPYPNSLLLYNVMYNKDGVSGYWQITGNYKVVIPANTVEIKLEDGTWVPNPRVELTYYCAGTGGFFRYDDGSPAKITTPQESQILAFPMVSNYGSTEKFPGAIFRFPTTLDREGYSTPLYAEGGKSEFEVPVIYNNGIPVLAPATITNTNRNDPASVIVDMSQFNNELGTYVIRFPEGIVYEENIFPYKDALCNAEAEFTFRVVDEITPDFVHLKFTGVKDAYKLVSIFDEIGNELEATSSVFNYQIDFDRSGGTWVTIWTPVSETVDVTAPEDLVENTDYSLVIQNENTPDDEQVKSITIEFLTPKVVDATFTIQIGEMSGDEPGDEPGDNPGGDNPGGDEPGDNPGEDDAVEGIEADAAPAVYYNLHGQRVLNPDRGVYVKVVNGKSVKVVL